MLRNAEFELRNILAEGDGDAELVGGTFAGVVLGQTLAQAIGLDANDGVGVLIEGGSAVEDLHADGVFLDLAGFPGKKGFTQVGQQMSECRRALEGFGLKHRLKFSALRFKIDRSWAC